MNIISFILHQILFEIWVTAARFTSGAAAASARVITTAGCTRIYGSVITTVRCAWVNWGIRRVIRFIRVSRVSGRAISLVLGGSQIHGVEHLLLSLKSGGLGNAACHEVELGVVDEVLEVNARGEDDVHARDVLRCERLATVSTDACERNPEVAELVEQDLLSLQQLLHKTAAHVGEHALHLSALVTSVTGNVVNKLAECHHLLHLGPGIRLWILVLLQLVLEHKNRIINHLIAHRRYGTWYLQGLMPCPAGVKQ